MANFTTSNASGIDMRNLWPGVGFATIASTIVLAPTTYTVDLSTGIRLIFTGTGFTYSGNTPTGGSYTSIEMRSNGGATLDGTFTVGSGTALLTNIGNGIDWQANLALLGGTSTVGGGNGADYLIGGIGNETITAGQGNDTIDGGDGVDAIDGGAGIDRVLGTHTGGQIIIDLNLGAAQGSGSWGSLANVEALGRSGSNFGGTNQDDSITTGDSAGFAGIDDYISTFGGNDYVAVAYGADVVDMGSGFDTLVVDYRHNTAPISTAAFALTAEMTGTITDNEAGALLDSVVFSGVSNFWLRGGSGGDTLRGGGGNDTIEGNDGNDVIHGNGGVDALSGGNGTDTLFASLSTYSAATVDIAAVQQISGTGIGTTATGFEQLGQRNVIAFVTTGGNDVVLTRNSSATGLDDYVSTGGGSDRVTMSRGYDQADLGTDVGGVDTLVLDYGWIASAIVSGPLTGGGANNLSGTVGDSLNNARTIFTGVERFEFSTGSGADELTGGNLDDVFSTGLGSDTVDAGSGDDTVNPGRGFDDLLTGGAGNDLLLVDYTGVGATNVSMSGGTTGSINTANNLNSISYLGFERFGIYSSTGNDTLRGDALADTLDGGAGNDSLVGGLGDDVYVVDTLLDVVVEAASAGTDTIYARNINYYTLGANVEVGRLTGTATAIVGNGLDNTLLANDAGLASILQAGAGNDVLYGAGGDDNLDGGSGNDVFYTGGGVDTCIGGTGDDQFVIYGLGGTITEQAGQGIDTVYVGVSGIFAADGNTEIIRLFGAGNYAIGNGGNEDLVANVTASTLAGSGGDDVLWGQGGADTLFGGAGNDIFRTGGGADQCTGNEGNDSYVILDTGATVTELAGQGYDIVYLGVAGSFAIGNFVEEARLFGAGNSLTGNAQDNLLVGNAAVASSIDAGAGNDLVYGGEQGDVLVGGAGNDILYGLGGADQFRYVTTSTGFDQIADFSQAQGDKLYMVGSGVTSFGQLSIVSGANTQITYGGNTIYLFNVASVSAADFIFA